MTSERVILVSPVLPTVLGDQTSHILPGQELWTNFVNNVHVYPAHLSSAIFEQALSKTLSAFPHTAGRLYRTGDEWEIRLTNGPVSVRVDTVVLSTREQIQSFPFPSEFVIQPPALFAKYISADYQKPVLRGEGMEPLLTVKLTYCQMVEEDGTMKDGGTVLGVSWNHTLGDAYALYQFMNYLSEMYQGLLQGSAASRDPPSPSLDRHFFPSPTTKTQEVAKEFIAKMPHLSVDYDWPQLTEMYTNMFMTTEPVQLRIPGEALDTLLEKAKEGEEPTEKLTVNDAMSAYLVTAVNKCGGIPVKVVINAVNYRLPAKATAPIAPFNHPRAMFNKLFMIFTDPIPPESQLSIAVFARAIRRAIEEARQPEFVDNWMTFGANFMKRSVNATRYPWFFANEGEWTVNSNYRYNWNDAHFGFPDRAKFFASPSFGRYFRMFVSNPGGVSAGRSRKGTWPVDVAFRIRKDLKEKIVQVIKEDIPDAVFEEPE